MSVLDVTNLVQHNLHNFLICLKLLPSSGQTIIWLSPVAFSCDQILFNQLRINGLAQELNIE